MFAESLNEIKQRINSENIPIRMIDKMKNIHQKFYTIIFTLSLILYLVSFFIQYPLVFSYSDTYGILFKMGWVYWIGYFLLLILIYFNFRYFKKIDKRFIYLSLMIFIIYLIGTPCFFEWLPRFEDTWMHSFLSQRIFEKEEVITRTSNYEEYPGSFLFFGLLFQIIPSYYVMKFFVPLFYFFAILIVYSLFKYLFNEKISFLASILYIFFNWTIEDNHISPQFLSLYLYFLFMLVLIKILSKPRKNLKSYIIITSLLSIVIVFSHPGTPIFIFLILGSMVFLCDKFRNVLIPVTTFLVLIFILYNLFLTTVFTSYSDIINDFFKILLTNDWFSRTTMRFSADLLSRKIFIYSRVGIMVFSIVIGLLGLFMTYKGGYKIGTKFLFSWTFSMIIFVVIVGLSLGGEYYEKFALISSLPLAGLVAYYLYLKDLKNWAIILIILLLISPFYFIAKYGNEAIESESLEKLKTDCFSYEFRDDCAESQKIIESPLYLNLKYFRDVDFTVTREEIMGYSLVHGKDIKTSQKIIDETFNGMDRIYSTNSAWFYT